MRQKFRFIVELALRCFKSKYRINLITFVVTVQVFAKKHRQIPIS